MFRICDDTTNQGNLHVNNFAEEVQPVQLLAQPLLTVDVDDDQYHSRRRTLALEDFNVDAISGAEATTTAVVTIELHGDASG